MQPRDNSCSQASNSGNDLVNTLDEPLAFPTIAWAECAQLPPCFAGSLN